MTNGLMINRSLSRIRALMLRQPRDEQRSQLLGRDPVRPVAHGCPSSPSVVKASSPMLETGLTRLRPTSLATSQLSN